MSEDKTTSFAAIDENVLNGILTPEEETVADRINRAMTSIGFQVKTNHIDAKRTSKLRSRNLSTIRNTRLNTPLMKIDDADQKSEEKTKIDHLNVNDELLSYKHQGIGKFFEKYAGTEFDSMVNHLIKQGDAKQ